MQKQSKINKEEFLNLYNKGINDSNISKYLNIPKSTIRYYRVSILKLPKVAENIKLSQVQEEILCGTLLGDSSILYVHKGCNYPHITYKHSKVQEEYFNHKYKIFSNLMSSYLERQYSITQIIKGKECICNPVLFAIGRNLKCLIQYRELFYPFGIKIIPIKFIEEHFTARSLAYLFMDDGCKNQKTININIPCFSIVNLQQFIKFLYVKFNLEFIIKKDKTLYLRYNSIKRFKELVNPFIIESMQYKLK